jgi:hypothetical protein
MNRKCSALSVVVDWGVFSWGGTNPRKHTPTTQRLSRYNESNETDNFFGSNIMDSITHPIRRTSPSNLDISQALYSKPLNGESAWVDVLEQENHPTAWQNHTWRMQTKVSNHSNIAPLCRSIPPEASSSGGISS